MKKIKIAIIIDHPDRDLDGLILLSHFFLRKNYEIMLVPMYYHSFEIPFIKPDIILFNNIGEHNSKFIKRYKSYGCTIALLNSEEGIRSVKMGADHPLKMAQLFKKNKYYKYIDLYFCWGSYVARLMKKYSGMKSENIIVSGCPKYDLCSQKIRKKIFSPKIIYDVMINTNFQATNSFHGDINLEKDKFLIYGMDKAYVNNLFKSYANTFGDYLRLLEEMFKKFKKKKFLLRPHPFEKRDVYIEKFKKYKNVQIDNKGTIFDTVAKTHLVMHLNCGSSVDALYLDKVPISFEFMNNDILKNNSPLPSKISLRARNKNELFKFIKSPSKIRFNFRKQRKLISKWFKFNELNQYSCENLVNGIEKFLKNKKKDELKKISILDVFKGGQSDFVVKNLVYRILYFFFGSYFLFIFEHFKSSAKLKVFKKKYVINFLNKILTNKKEINKINVKYCKHSINKSNLRSINLNINDNDTFLKRL